KGYIHHFPLSHPSPLATILLHRHPLTSSSFSFFPSPPSSSSSFFSQARLPTRSYLNHASLLLSPPPSTYPHRSSASSSTAPTLTSPNRTMARASARTAAWLGRPGEGSSGAGRNVASSSSADARSASCWVVGAEFRGSEKGGMGWWGSGEAGV